MKLLSTLMVLTGGFTPALFVATKGVGNWFHDIDPGLMIYAATTLIGFLGLLLQIQDNRKRAERDREQDQRQRDNNSRELASKVRESARAVEQTTERHAAALKGMIAENTAISERAFVEANNVNAKIASLGQKLVDKPSLVVIPSKRRSRVKNK